jgi:hypothetical protein
VSRFVRATDGRVSDDREHLGTDSINEAFDGWFKDSAAREFMGKSGR